MAAASWLRGVSLPRGWKWLRATAIAEGERWTLWLPVALGSGVALYFALPFEPSAVLALPFLIAALLVSVVAATSDTMAARVSLGLLAAFTIGFAVAQLRTAHVAAPLLVHRIGPAMVNGRVESAQRHGKSVRVVLEVASIGHIRPDDQPAKVRVSIRSGAENLRPGDHIAVRAVLMPPPAPASPGDYDFGRAAYYLRIGAVGYAYGKPAMLGAAPASGWIAQWSQELQLLRYRMTQHIQSVLPGSDGGIASAIITGDRGAISPDDESALRDAGLAHVLAIAGLHMALVGLGLFWIVRALLALVPSIALVYPIKKWAAVAALVGASIYLIIGGAAVPATRAYVMLATMLLAILFDRPALSMRSVALAAAVILLLRPESLIEPGFQMSFAAVVSLVAVAEWERARAAPQTSIWPLAGARHYLRGIAVTSFVGSLATAPFAAFHFDRATHYAVLGNLLAMPIMGFVTMPSAALAVLLMPFGLDRLPLIVMGWGIDAMLAVGRWVSHLPGAVSMTAAWPVAAIATMALGGLWVALWRTGWHWLGLAPVCAGLFLALAATPPDLLIARDGMTVAIRGKDGALRLLRPPSDKYSASEWLKRDGDDRDIATVVATPQDGVRCDADGCVAKSPNGLLIAAALRPTALAEDCAASDIVISAAPTRGLCIGPKLVIDRFDVARNGSYAIWFGSALRIETASDARGQRPWNPAPRTRRARQ